MNSKLWVPIKRVEEATSTIAAKDKEIAELREEMGLVRTLNRESNEKWREQLRASNEALAKEREETAFWKQMGAGVNEALVAAEARIAQLWDLLITPESEVPWDNLVKFAGEKDNLTALAERDAKRDKEVMAKALEDAVGALDCRPDLLYPAEVLQELRSMAAKLREEK